MSGRLGYRKIWRLDSAPTLGLRRFRLRLAVSRREATIDQNSRRWEQAATWGKTTAPGVGCYVNCYVAPGFHLVSIRFRAGLQVTTPGNSPGFHLVSRWLHALRYMQYYDLSHWFGQPNPPGFTFEPF